MSLLLRAVLEDMDGIFHRAAYPASTGRVDKWITRRSSRCFRRIKGFLRDPTVHPVNCMECLIDDHER